MDLRSLFKHAEESPWCTLLHGVQFSADLPLSLQKPPSLIRLAILNWISFSVSFFLFISIVYVCTAALNQSWVVPLFLNVTHCFISVGLSTSTN